MKCPFLPDWVGCFYLVCKKENCPLYQNQGKVRKKQPNCPHCGKPLNLVWPCRVIYEFNKETGMYDHRMKALDSVGCLNCEESGFEEEIYEMMGPNKFVLREEQ